MGYCSEVAFACPYEDFISLDKQLKDKGFTLFDSVSDLDSLPRCAPGSTAIVLEDGNATVFMKNTEGKWVKL